MIFLGESVRDRQWGNYIYTHDIGVGFSHSRKQMAIKARMERIEEIKNLRCEI